MEALEMEMESFTFPACGTQHEAVKRTLPKWSLPKATRDSDKKVFISKQHPQDLIGKDGPGFQYSPKRQMHATQWSFGTAPARPPMAKAKYPETSNDLIRTNPDSLPFKKSLVNTTIGTSMRNARLSAPGLIGFPKGEISPGPQHYKPERAPPAFRHAHAPKVDEIQPKYTMRQRTKIQELESQTPAKVGPASYPVPEACTKQSKSDKKSLPQWSLMKTDRFPQREQRKDAGRLWDGMGEKKIEFSRAFSTPASFSFGTSTRGAAQKVAPAHTAADKGPAGRMGKNRENHPEIAPRREILKYT